MAPFILGEKSASLERSFPTSSQLCTLSHCGLAQVVSSDDLGNRRGGLTPPQCQRSLPHPPTGIVPPRAEKDAPGRDDSQWAGLQTCRRAALAAMPCPASTRLLECAQLCSKPLAHCTIYWGYNIIAMQNSVSFSLFFSLVSESKSSKPRLTIYIYEL